LRNSGEHGGGSASDGRPNVGDDELISEPAGDGLRAGMTLSGTVFCTALVVKSTGASTASGTTVHGARARRVELEGEDSEECGKLESSERNRVCVAEG
jgi:hypothetical protein